MSKFRRPPLSLAQQFLALKSDVPGQGELSHKRLRWNFVLQPTPLSRAYELMLTYRLHESPNVFVVNPDLNELAEGKPIPHLYDHKRVRLCLYLPKTGEWNKYMLLRDTIVPWSSLWLYYFEDWLHSGEWRGGGIHPESNGSKDDKNDRKKKRKKKR